MIPYKQLSLADIFSDCHEKFENDKPAFLSLLETHIDIDELIPIEQNRCAMACQGCGAVLFLLKKQWNYFP